MQQKTKENIIKLKSYGLDLYDIKLIKNTALENKMYDLIVYINNTPFDYLNFIAQLNEKKP